MSAFADALAAVPPTRRPSCTMGLAMAGMDEDDRSDLERALDGEWTNKQIAQALQALGLDVEPQTVGRHRNGECKCPR